MQNTEKVEPFLRELLVFYDAFLSEVRSVFDDSEHNPLEEEVDLVNRVSRDNGSLFYLAEYPTNKRVRGRNQRLQDLEKRLVKKTEGIATEVGMENPEIIFEFLNRYNQKDGSTCPHYNLIINGLVVPVTKETSIGVQFDGLRLFEPRGSVKVMFSPSPLMPEDSRSGHVRSYEYEHNGRSCLIRHFGRGGGFGNDGHFAMDGEKIFPFQVDHGAGDGFILASPIRFKVSSPEGALTCFLAGLREYKKSEDYD